VEGMNPERNCGFGLILRRFGSFGEDPLLGSKTGGRGFYFSGNAKGKLK